MCSFLRTPVNLNLPFSKVYVQIQHTNLVTLNIFSHFTYYALGHAALSDAVAFCPVALCPGGLLTWSRPRYLNVTDLPWRYRAICVESRGNNQMSRLYSCL